MAEMKDTATCRLACPVCGGGLRLVAAQAECPACALAYRRTCSGGYDFMPPDSVLVRHAAPARIAEWREALADFVRWSAANYTVEYVRDEVALYDAHYRPFLESAGLGGDILDIGGGYGLIRKYFSQAQVRQYVVIEPDMHRYVSRPPGLEDFLRPLTMDFPFHLGIGEMLPFAEGEFDAVLMIAMLDHVFVPGRVIAEALRVLKPGGRMVIIQEIDRPVVRQMTLREKFGRKLREGGWPALTRAVAGAVLYRLGLRRGGHHMQEFTEMGMTALTGAFERGREEVKQVNEIMNIWMYSGRKPGGRN